MEYKFKYRTDLHKKDQLECLVVFVPECKEKNMAQELDGLDQLPKPLRDSLLKYINAKLFCGKLGETQLYLPTDGTAERVMLAGLGPNKKLDPEVIRRAAGKVGKNMNSLKLKKIGVQFHGQIKKSWSANVGSLLAEGLLLGGYAYNRFKTKDQDNTPKSVSITFYDHQKAASTRDLEHGQILAEGTMLARNLGNDPANVLTPTEMANIAHEIAQNGGLEIEVIEEEKMRELGMGMFLGVSQGSSEPAKLIIMRYNHPDAKDTVAIVGKGVTFDSGGISIKPGKDMDEMKMDMCGAAAVLGAMQAISRIQPKVNVVGAMAATENMPGQSAQRPGDIVTALNGKTVEILNTDAEGRLILGDTLTYVAREYKPKAMVNLATLTGAVIVGLGHYAIGAITNDDPLMRKVAKAGQNSGEIVWELPNFPEYEEQLKGKYGDLQNIGGRSAGSITAGLFLKNFVENTSWVHLDIAGTAWGVNGIDYIPSAGATGVGVRLLTELIETWK